MSAKLTVGSLAVCLIAVAAAVIVGKNPFLRGSSETPLQIEQPDQHKTGVMTQTQDSETPLRIEQPDQHKTDGTKQTEDAGAKREKAAISYINADFASRYKYVLNGAALREEMAKYYSHSGVNSVEKTIAVGVTVLDENRAIVAVAANRGNADVYLRRAGDDWLVDWPATVGLNEVTVKVIKATAPKSSIRLRVKAQLDDSYYDGIRREDYYSISLTENWRPLGDYDSLNGYVLKDSKIGKDLFRIVSDGREHQVIVTVQCIRGGGMDLAMVMIDSLVSENWFVD
jgi:hypothetical protein